MKKIFFVFAFFSFTSFSEVEKVSFLPEETGFAQYVDPFIGTGGHGHTFPGATTPFGMVQLSPDTRIDGSWDGCSGYHYSDSIIYGFSHTHLSGTGCSDWGDIMLMPMMGKPSFNRNEYSSTFSHKNERAAPGSYSVKLKDDDIDVELTTTARTGFHKYTFNTEGDAYIVLDLSHRDILITADINNESKIKISGYRQSKAWANSQTIYYQIEFSTPFSDNKMLVHKEEIAAYFHFKVKKGESILMKVSLSSVDTEGARKNMEAELPGWDFEKVKKAAEALWNKELSKIEVTSNDKDKLKIFYTALYHCMIHPGIASDVDGRYRGMDNKIYTAKDFNYYTVFSLWDTFRALHPLLSIIDKKRTLDFIKTFLEMYKQTGRLPVWELSSNETDCMIGYHCVSAIADSYIKGIKDFDTELAMKAMIDMSNLENYRGLDAYKKKGFLEVEDEPESVSKTLEYAYDDWCIAQFAKAIGKDSIYNEYTIRAQSWKNVFNPETGFMQPRSNGGWQKDFDPKRVDNNFTEGNSWQYSFFVPQDIYGLIDAMGGTVKFEKKLDELFSSDSKTTGREQADITGLIGQYAHGNEPSHHMAYLYNYVGKPEKTQQRIKQILDDFYKTGPEGLIGNEDCGQMSAWYVLSSLGVYPVCPGREDYATGLKYYDKVKILGDENLISKLTAIKSNSLKKSLNIIPAPVVSASSQIFSDSLKIEIQSVSNDTILYQVYNGLVDVPVYYYYTKPFSINKTSHIYAYCKNGKTKSKIIAGVYYKKPNSWSVKIISKYKDEYSAGGDGALIDGLRGDVNWRKGRWQGYQGQNFECVIDLKEEKNISVFSAGFLQDQRSWILMPTKVEFYISYDGEKFVLAQTINNDVEDKDETVQIIDFRAPMQQSVKVRYVKAVAYNYGKLPAWHQGSGGDAYIFVDEIIIE